MYLQESHILNYSDPSIQSYVKRIVKGKLSIEDQATALFYAVRDDFLYNPYYINTSIEELQVSNVIQRGFGHCIDKAGLLIACYRACGIPSRIGLAKVKNHIATEKLEEYLGSKVLAPHGYVEVYLNKTWWKITPAFNQSLCNRLGVANLEFNGANHCLFQEYNNEGTLFMEYIEDYGHFEDIPIQFIIQTMLDHYPKLRSQNSKGVKIDLGMFNEYLLK